MEDQKLEFERDQFVFELDQIQGVTLAQVVDYSLDRGADAVAQ